MHLNEAGHFIWSDWAERFGATLRHNGNTRSLNGGDDYFVAWLETLETVLAESEMVAPAQVENMRAAWAQAYLDTPHGAPVTLD